ncbi:MAG: trypsin-like serine protease [Rhodomicrobium sp.]|nr:trypsin-like serine protease [Rhodomicrobium sp.]
MRRFPNRQLCTIFLAFQFIAWIYHPGQLRAGMSSLPHEGYAAPFPFLPVAIFGNDERRDLPEELSALEGRIGMLYEQSTQTLCTAFCVSKEIIATAAHCLFQPKNGRLPDLSEVTFRLNYGNTYQQTGIFGRRTPYTKHYIAVGTTAFNNEPPLSAPRDWALVKLERPICRFGVLRIETNAPSDLIKKSKENKIFQVAYHWDYKHWQLAYSTPCSVKQDYDQIKWRFIRQHFIDHDQLILHNCDTGGASSGSPILLNVDPPNLPVAVAINVGTYTRTRILLRNGQVVKKLNPDIIANTAVNSSAFRNVIPELEAAELINSHEDMIRLQSELQTRGLYAGVIDGELGRGTRSAILNFEASIGLPPTGLPTIALLRRFGEERMRPAHMYSNGRGVVSDPEQTTATPSAANAIVPKPLKRPSVLIRKKPFNPFSQF